MRDFLKERYDFEIDRKENLSASLNTSITILVIVGGALLYLASNWREPFTVYTWISLLLGLLCAVALIRSVLFLLRILRGFEYSYLPDAKGLLEHKNELTTYASQYAGQVADAEKLFDEYLIGHLAEAATKNQESNTQKSYCISTANKSLIVASCLCAASAAPFFAGQIIAPEKDQTQEVRVVGPVQVNPFLNLRPTITQTNLSPTLTHIPPPAQKATTNQ